MEALLCDYHVQIPRMALGRQMDPPDVDEYSVAFPLAADEVGEPSCVDAVVSAEAIAAAKTDYRRLFADEFVEGISHSHMARWCTDWMGFRANITAVLHDRCHAPRRSGGSALQPKTRTLKHVVMRAAYSSYRHPRVLCFRLLPWSVASRERCRVRIIHCGAPDKHTSGCIGDIPHIMWPRDSPCKVASQSVGARPAASACEDVLDSPSVLYSALRRFLFGMGTDTFASLLHLFGAQLADVISDLAEGSYFQFAAASVWLMFDACGCSASEAAACRNPPTAASRGSISDLSSASTIEPHRKPPSVRLTHFSGLTMHRTPGCDERFLLSLRALHAALCASVLSAQQQQSPSDQLEQEGRRETCF